MKTFICGLNFCGLFWMFVFWNISNFTLGKCKKTYQKLTISLTRIWTRFIDFTTFPPIFTSFLPHFTTFEPFLISIWTDFNQFLALSIISNWVVVNRNHKNSWNFLQSWDQNRHHGILITGFNVTDHNDFDPSHVMSCDSS